MEPDTEGFLYPIIDNQKCTKCNQCKKVCHAISPENERKPLRVYATKNIDEKIRSDSSSGGAFTMLAEHIINIGGVVFGAKFNNDWKVVHDYTETKEGLAVFRGSKYVQSNIGNVYVLAKNFLLAGREVLFSGTPCQIAGLKHFLQKDYSNLLTVDFVCRGVPSPLVWQKYLDELIDKKSDILDIRFRDKRYGWKKYSFVIDINNNSSLCIPKDEFSFRKGFLQNLYLRLSCYNCPVKPLKSGSDITIGDYWGIWNILPEFDDDKGVSLVLNTEKGEQVYKLLSKNDKETELRSNLSLEKSSQLSTKRSVFFKKWLDEPIIPLIKKMTADSLQIWLKKIITTLLRKIGLLLMVKSMLNKIKRR